MAGVFFFLLFVGAASTSSSSSVERSSSTSTSPSSGSESVCAGGSSKEIDSAAAVAAAARAAGPERLEGGVRLDAAVGPARLEVGVAPVLALLLVDPFGRPLRLGVVAGLGFGTVKGTVGTHGGTDTREVGLLAAIPPNPVNIAEGGKVPSEPPPARSWAACTCRNALKNTFIPLGASGDAAVVVATASSGDLVGLDVGVSTGCSARGAVNGVWAAGVGRWGRGRAPGARRTAAPAPCPPGLDRGGATRAGLLVGRAGGGGIEEVGIIEGQIDGHVSERVERWG